MIRIGIPRGQTSVDCLTYQLLFLDFDGSGASTVPSWGLYLTPSMVTQPPWRLVSRKKQHYS